MSSDHFPISVNLNISGHNNIKNEKEDQRFNFSKANWYFYHKILFDKANHYSTCFINYLDVYSLNSLVMNDIFEAANLSIPKFLKKPKKSLPKEKYNL